MSHRSRSHVVIHTVWSTRHRLPTLRRAADSWLHEQLRHEADKLGSEVVAVGNANDHVHLLTTVRQDVSLSALMKQVKGASSRAWNLQQPLPPSEWHPLIWQDGFWAESCSPRHLEILTRYVASQRDMHRDDSPFESWMISPDMR